MLTLFILSQETHSTIMMSIAIFTFIMNGTIIIVSNRRYKIKQLSKKADFIYVDKEISRVKEDFNTQIGYLRSEQRSFNEEQHALLEHINKKVDFIYQKHFK